MKILQVVPFFTPARGGSVVVPYNLSKQLAERGHEVTVFTTDFELDNEYVHSLDGVVRVVPFHCIANVGGMLISPNMKRQLKEEIKDFDIIHMHNFRNYQNVVVHRYAKKYNVPYILDPGGSILKLGKQKLKKVFDTFFGYGILRDVSKVIAGTEMEMNEEKAMGVDSEKIALILPGYDTNSFSDLPDPGKFRNKFGIVEKNIILFLARIHAIKGIDFLVKSLYELTCGRDDTILVIAGPDDSYKSTVKKLIDELNLSNKVLFTGGLYEDEKLSAYVDATMLVQPSKYERFCGSPFEAILCNTPIIVTKNTGCGNFVDKMDMGYAVDYDDIIALRDTMDRILNDPSEAQLKTQRCKKYIISNLTLEKQIEKYENLYRELIGGKKQ